MSGARLIRPLPLVLFLIGCTLAACSRDTFDVVLRSLADGTYVPEATCLTCHRNVAWIYWPLRGLLEMVSQLLFLGPDAGPWPVATPWPYPDSGHQGRLAILLLSHYGMRVILALPVYWLACRLFPNPLHRLAYVAAALCVIGGWPAALVSGWFQLMRNFVDWPPAYYLFSHALITYDWASLGFVHLLALVLLRHRTVPLWLAVALATLGQVCMDNLGLVAGLAMALAAWRGDGWRAGAMTLVAAGFGAALAALAFMLGGGMTMEHAGMAAASTVEGGTPLDRLAAWWRYYWDLQGKYNFLWLNVTIANMVSLLALPVLAGALLGLFARPDQRSEGCTARAALGFPILALTLTLALGLTKSGFGSDMGRQLVPLASLILPFTLMLAHGLRTRRR